MPNIKKDGARYGKPIKLGVVVPQIVADIAVKMIQDGKMTQKEAITILKNAKKKK